MKNGIIKCLGIFGLCTCFLCGAFHTKAEAVVFEDYLARSLTWTTETYKTSCKAETKTTAMSRPYYTNVVLFTYKTQDGPVWKSKQKNSGTSGANVNVEISRSYVTKQVGIAKAKAVHYITSKSDGEGVVYGYKAIVKSKGSSY